MADMQRLMERLYEKLHRRPAGIDRMDRLWEAAVLVPLVRTEEGPAVLFEVRSKTLEPAERVSLPHKHLFKQKQKQTDAPSKVHKM